MKNLLFLTNFIYCEKNLLLINKLVNKKSGKSMSMIIKAMSSKVSVVEASFVFRAKLNASSDDLIWKNISHSIGICDSFLRYGYGNDDEAHPIE